jgi:hypothetical protein
MHVLVSERAPLLWCKISWGGRQLRDGIIGLGEALALDPSGASDWGDLRTAEDCRRWFGGVGGAFWDCFDVGGSRFVVRGVVLGRLGGRCDKITRGDWGRVRVAHTTSRGSRSILLGFEVSRCSCTTSFCTYLDIRGPRNRHRDLRWGDRGRARVPRTASRCNWCLLLCISKSV